MSRKNAIKPLSEKLTREQQEQRILRINMRRDRAIQQGILASVVALLRRGFFGRVKWLIRGV
jgi:hypothetical protein